MDVFKTVLKEICRSRIVSPYIISAKTKVSIEKVESVLGALLSSGVVGRKIIENCEACPLRSICPYAGKTNRTVIYYITEK